MALSVSAILGASGCFVSPKPMSDDEHMGVVAGDKEALRLMQSVPAQPVTLCEAIARTIKYNLDNRLILMDSVLAMQQLEAANLQMLPSLAVNAGYSFRSNESASSSISYQTRKQSLEPSFSSKRQHATGDLSFSWSLLDFGISYFHAKQQANRHLILLERRRRVTNNLIKDVIGVYYQLASLEAIRPQVEEAIEGAEEALAVYRKLEERKNAPLGQVLEQQRQIINLLSQLRQLFSDLEMSRVQLAALMNVPNGVPFELARSDCEAAFSPPVLNVPLEALEELGLFMRPDLREESLQARVDRDEVKKELIRMFPGVTLFQSANYDANPYLVNQFWLEAGARVTMDIIGLAGKHKQVKTAKTQVKIAKMRRLAAMVAAQVQIDMSFHQYRQSVRRFEEVREVNRIEGKLLELSEAELKSKAAGKLDHIMQIVSSVNTRLEMDRQKTLVLSAWANLYFSIGCDLIPEADHESSIESLIEKADAGLQRWLSGELPSVASNEG